MTRKILFLFLALALPGLIYVFLRTFGRNEFNVPVLHTTSADSVNQACGTHYVNPIRIPDSVRSGMNASTAKAVVVVRAPVADPGLKGLEEIFDTTAFKLIRLTPEQENRWAACVFLIPSKKNAMLFDRDGSIRGYYSIRPDRKELDRLQVEIEILLKRYE